MSHTCGEKEAGILGSLACAQYADPQRAFCMKTAESYDMDMGTVSMDMDEGGGR